MIHSLFIALALSSTALTLGDKAPLPEVKMKNVDGRELSLASVAGPKGTLVIFSCGHCPYVKAWEDRLVALGNDYSKKGFGVIAINSNDPKSHDEDKFDAMVDRSKSKNMDFAYAVDATSEIAKAFAATKTPEAFLFDAKGKLVYHGAIDDNSSEPAKVTKQYLKEALDAVLLGKAVPLAETKALGCGIKFRS